MIKKIKCLLVSVLFFLVGCSSVDKNLEPYQGAWYDVNSATSLTIAGNEMKILFGGTYEEKHRIRIAEKYGSYEIEAEDGEGFGDMSPISVNSDGSLRAYEMVLDTDGHIYNFVREEQLTELREIRDLSEDLPKEIMSDVISSFSLYFSTDNGHLYDLGDRYANADYSLAIERENGVYHCDFSQTYDSYMGEGYHGEVEEAFVLRLAEIIRSESIPEKNGYYHRNEVDSGNYSLYITFDSGEEIRIRAFGDAAENCIFNLRPFIELIESVSE